MAVKEQVIKPRHIRLSNKSGECIRLYEFLADSFEHLPVNKEFRHDLKLVSEELLANIINHGYEDSTEGHIDIELAADEHSVYMTFTDSARAFNPLERNHPDILNDLAEGGMGLLLVKSLTDEQCYKRDNNHNVLTVTKNYNT
ncbi:MAG: ATP-binding protein [Gammaproteobacteria bacterium]|jgi:anti-sigma regulatory factor (Ser/Thr protein kinase)